MEPYHRDVKFLNNDTIALLDEKVTEIRVVYIEKL
jgi:hypothetical protein